MVGRSFLFIILSPIYFMSGRCRPESIVFQVERLFFVDGTDDTDWHFSKAYSEDSMQFAAESSSAFSGFLSSLLAD
jgi:hypothetical protein